MLSKRHQGCNGLVTVRREALGQQTCFLVEAEVGFVLGAGLSSTSDSIIFLLCYLDEKPHLGYRCTTRLRCDTRL